MRNILSVFCLFAALCQPARAGSPSTGPDSCSGVHAGLSGLHASLSFWYMPGRQAEIRSNLDVLGGWTRSMGSDPKAVALVSRCALVPLGRLRATLMGMYPETGPLQEPAAARSRATALVAVQNLLLKAQNLQLAEIVAGMKRGEPALIEQVLAAASAFAACDGEAYLASLSGGKDYKVGRDHALAVLSLDAESLAERARSSCREKARGS